MHLAHFQGYVIQHSAMNSTSEYLNTVSYLALVGKGGEGIRKRLGCETKEEGRQEEWEELSLARAALKLQ